MKALKRKTKWQRNGSPPSPIAFIQNDAIKINHFFFILDAQVFVSIYLFLKKLWNKTFKSVCMLRGHNTKKRKRPETETQIWASLTSFHPM